MNDPPKHAVTMSVDRGWPEWSMCCPHDIEDRSRPCWPCDESGQPDADSDECTYVQWFENDGPDSITAAPKVTYEVDDADWTGDCFHFTLKLSLCQPEGETPIGAECAPGVRPDEPAPVGDHRIDVL